MIEGTICTRCGYELREGEVAGYHFDIHGVGHVMCAECIREEIMALPDDELFAALGYEPETVISQDEYRFVTKGERDEI